MDCDTNWNLDLMLAHTPFPLVLVTKAGGMLAVNDAARRHEDAYFASSGPTKILRDEYLRFIRQVASRPKVEKRYAFRIQGKPGNPPDESQSWWIVILPLIDKGEERFAISFRDLNDEECFSLDFLMSSLGLTQSEAAVGVALAQGATLIEYADRTKRGIATVRWHLSNALKKTNCRSQAEFIRLIHLVST